MLLLSVLQQLLIMRPSIHLLQLFTLLTHTRTHIRKHTHTHTHTYLFSILCLSPNFIHDLITVSLSQFSSVQFNSTQLNSVRYTHTYTHMHTHTHSHTHKECT